MHWDLKCIYIIIIIIIIIIVKDSMSLFFWKEKCYHLSHNVVTQDVDCDNLTASC